MDVKEVIMSGAGFIISKIPHHVYHRLYIRSYPYLRGVDEERKASFDYPYFIAKKKGSKEKYCIFRYSMPTYNILAAGRQFLFAASWAEKKGMIPLLDLELEYEFETYRIAESNLWDDFFNQPITVAEALNKDWVLVESFHSWGMDFKPFDTKINGKKGDYTLHLETEDWRNYYVKAMPYVNKYWSFRGDILERFSKCREEKIKNGNGVLGILLREELSADADQYLSSKEAQAVYNRHPKTIGVKQVIKQTKKYMEQWGCDKIFVATQYQDSLKEFQKEFGEKLIFINRERRQLEQLRHENSVWGQTSREYWEYYNQEKIRQEAHEKTEAYLQEIYILSECQCFLASKCSGAIAALCFNGGRYREFACLQDVNNNKY